MFQPDLSMRSKTLLVAAPLLWIACSAGFHSSFVSASAALSFNPVSGEVKEVLISHFKYQPDTLALKVGDTVEWQNVDIVPHTATAVDRKTFDSGRIAKGASWRFTLTRKGTYDYLCTLHPNMKAKLIVR